MTDSRSPSGSNLGPTSTRRRIATVIAVVGMLFVGSRLASVWPRETSVAYEVGADVRALDVDYLQDGEAVCSARFGQPERKTRVFRHTARLQPGRYQVAITLRGDHAEPVQVERTLVVPGGELTTFDLRGTTEGRE